MGRRPRLPLHRHAARAPATCRWAWRSCVPRAEVIIVTTPALAAQKVASRAVSMARKSYLRVAGVDREHERVHLRARHELSAVRRGRRRGCAREPACRCSARCRSSRRSRRGDTGEPVALGDGPAAEAFRAIADRIVEEAVPPVEMAGCSARMLEAAVPRSTTSTTTPADRPPLELRVDCGAIAPQSHQHSCGWEPRRWG